MFVWCPLFLSDVYSLHILDFLLLLHQQPHASLSGACHHTVWWLSLGHLVSWALPVSTEVAGIQLQGPGCWVLRQACDYPWSCRHPNVSGYHGHHPLPPSAIRKQTAEALAPVTWLVWNQRGWVFILHPVMGAFEKHFGNGHGYITA